MTYKYWGEKNMGLKWCSSENNCSCKNYNEFELKLKCMKTQIHTKYIAGIAIGIVVWLIATGTHNNAEFVGWVSFAGTIPSIILSVIAIFMSISGENKTEIMRDRMDEAAKNLEKTAKDIELANKKNMENVRELKQNIVLLQDKIESLQGKTNEVLNRYEKLNEKSLYEDKTVKTELVWGKKDGK